ncbi:MAG: hypothetical protein LJE85_13215 [Gammaproteobacteria bacterium]|jgi:hypothetical protein|nr:hypothetical protein [Gammaproteobacteria bacterium]
MFSNEGRAKQQLARYIGLIGLIALLFEITACENGIEGTGDNPGPNKTSQGIVQKGPFEIGSNVVITTRPGPDYVQTRVDQLQTLDDIGTFEFTFEQDTLYEIAVTGKHFNEITGELSQDPMTLKSTYYHDENRKSFVSINILTHLIHSRINHLITVNQLHPRDAVAQASQELIGELKNVIFADHLVDYSFSNMTVYNKFADSDANANAILLFISAAFYQQSELYDNSRSIVEMLDTIVEDLEMDGKIDGDETQDPDQIPETSLSNGPVFISSLDFAARFLNPDVISANLTQYSIEKTGSAIAVPDINFLLDNDADGATNDIDTDDDGDGIPDDLDSEPFHFEISLKPQTFDTSPGISIDLDLEFNTPEDPIANPVFLGIVSQPQNGVLSGVYPALKYIPNQDFTGADSFTYNVNCVPCTAVATSVYTSSSVTVTINVAAP